MENHNRYTINTKYFIIADRQDVNYQKNNHSLQKFIGFQRE